MNGDHAYGSGLENEMALIAANNGSPRDNRSSSVALPDGTIVPSATPDQVFLSPQEQMQLQAQLLRNILGDPAPEGSAEQTPKPPRRKNAYGIRRTGSLRRMQR